MPRLDDGTPYPSVEQEPLGLEEMRALAWWYAHRPRSVRRLTLQGRGVLTNEIRRLYYDACRATAIMMADQPSLTISKAWARCRGRLYPPPEHRQMWGEQ